MPDVEFTHGAVQANADMDRVDALVLEACAKAVAGELSETKVAEALPAGDNTGVEALQRAMTNFTRMVEVLLFELAKRADTLGSNQDAVRHDMASVEDQLGASFAGYHARLGADHDLR
ncbi:MAG: hypothetical protein Q4D79_02440 [Propionibacteriaceae bacterium]|nr:hypothetical protein [Propionibacteriaceae bacterium]